MSEKEEKDPEEPEENPHSGFYTMLGMITGFVIGLAAQNLAMGVMLGAVISVAMEWGHNLYALYLKNKYEDDD